MLKFFGRFFVAMLVVSVPVAILIGYIHHANRPDLRPVAIPPPLEAQPLPPSESSPYARRIAAERRFQERLQAEYARGYKDGLKGRQARP